MFKLIGPLNPPKKGGLIILESPETDARQTGCIVKTSMYTRSQVSYIPNDDVLFFARSEWDGQTNSEQYSPFGDTGYQLEIVWLDGGTKRREFWMLAHPEPTCLGKIDSKVTDELEDSGSKGVAVHYNDLQYKLRVLVA